MKRPTYKLLVWKGDEVKTFEVQGGNAFIALSRVPREWRNFDKVKVIKGQLVMPT